MLNFNQKMLLILGIVIMGVLIIFAVNNLEKTSQTQNSGQNNPPAIQWNDNLDSAINTAQKSNKLIFVDFYADWCGYCKQLDEKTYPNGQVEEVMAQKYVAVKVNVDQNPDLASKYSVYGLPTLVIMDSNGNEIKKVEGYQTPTELLNIL
jgi:thioredoxin 1